MEANLLLTPGPTKVPREVYEALAKPILHHRTPQFQQYLKEAAEGLQYVLQTKNDVYIMASSGTGAMEACVSSLLSPGDHAITVEGGKFGERWTELCRAYRIEPHVIPLEWGKAVLPSAVKEALTAHGDVKAVFVTLCETSTGVTMDIEGIGRVVKDTNAVLVVDAVSGLGVTDLQTDRWSVDAVAAASHKGLMLPPGLGFVSVSPKAQTLIDRSASPRFYFDLKSYRKAAQKTDTPFTPAIGLVVALLESLKIIRKEGLQNTFRKFERLARVTREAVKALGLTLYADASCISDCLTPINVPEGIDGSKLVKLMRDTMGVTIAGGQGPLKGKIIRIAHMGCVDERDILKGLTILEKALGELGYSFKKGTSVSLAEKLFSEV